MKVHINIVMKQFVKKIYLNKIIRNSVWLLFDKGARLIGGLLVGAAVARYLGPEQYGLLAFSVAYTSLFISFSMCGIDNLVIRELNKNKFDKNMILGTAIRIRNLGSLVSLVFSLSIGAFFYFDQKNFLVVISIFMIGNFFQSMDVISLWYQSKTLSKIVVKNKLIAYVIVSLLKVVAVFLGMDLIWFALFTVVELLIGILLILRHYTKIDQNLLSDWLFSKPVAMSFLKEGWPLALSGLCIIIFMKSDQILIANFLGKSSVGIYSVATIVSDILYSVPLFILASAFPKLTKLYSEDLPVYEHYCRKIFLLMVTYSYIAIILVNVLAEMFVIGLYGEAYREAVEVIRIHSLTLLFVSIGCVRGNIMIIEHKSSLSLVITIICGIISVILNCLLIPRYGILGAALAVLIAQACSGYISSAFFKELRALFFIQTKMIFLYPVWKMIIKKSTSV